MIMLFDRCLKPAMTCRWDESCCEDEEWQRSAGVGDLQQGAAQRWYHVLLDHRDWPQDQPAVAYAAEELLSAPQVGAMTHHNDGRRLHQC